MKRELEEKIKFEWEKFYLDCMRTSKENIFTKSQEITLKREIKSCLMEIDIMSYGKLVLQKMLGLENIIEACYRYILELDLKNPLKMQVCSWVKSL